MPELNHLLAAGFTDTKNFKSMLSAPSRPSQERDRTLHGAGLMAQLQGLKKRVEQLRTTRLESGFSADQGVAISLEISPPGALDAGTKLEWKRDGIEVLNVTNPGEGEVITVFVPDGKLAAFEKRVAEYLSIDVPPRKPGGTPKPKNASLINAISTFRQAAFSEFWTDHAPLPDEQEVNHFTVWLRLGKSTSQALVRAFRVAAAPLGIEVQPGYISFPGRVVVAVHASRAALEHSLQLLDLVAEIRSTSPSAAYFLADLKPYEQALWVQDLAQRTVYPELEGVPFVTLLDTGVNRAHPLLDPFIDANDLYAVGKGWLATDQHGHGSSMAGVALYGDLRIPLTSQDHHFVCHRLESVKILPDQGGNPQRLYGWTANEAIRLVEAAAKGRKRTFTMMTTATGQTAGMPSEWSATIDRLAFGLDGDSLSPLDLPAIIDKKPSLAPRLFVLAAGNIPWDQWHNYPTVNDLETIEDPAQAWNALTVGAYTTQITFDQNKWPSLTTIAPQGALAPASRTSVGWSRSWPHKPDVVAEGGNACLDGRVAQSVTVGPEDLRVLSTSHEPHKELLAETGDTSAATAEVARLCSLLHHRYPSFWPETIRALVVDGAKYTSVMWQQGPTEQGQLAREALLGRYGYGCVRPEVSLNSSPHRPTVVLQESIVPYVRDGAKRKLGQINMHELPWPRHELELLGEAEVDLKVTLSYFIQPNPSRRGWQGKFRYQNFALRFAIRGASETSERFHQRINKIERDEMGDFREDSMPDPDSTGWFLRSRLRSRGSLHSDTWSGTAAALANKSEIAVFPVGGWWKEIGAMLKEDLEMRYALVISLEVRNKADVDIYAPIANAIAATVVTEIDTP